MASKKKLTTFWKVYLIVFGVLFVLLTGLLAVGYGLMMDYHETQSFPRMNANNYAKTLTQGSYGLICNDDLNAASVFENEKYSEIINDKIAGSVITCEKGFSSDRYSRPIYTIKADGEAIADVAYKLKKNKSTFGFAVYDFDHVYSRIKGDYEINFIVPDNSIATLNGVTVGENWIAEKNIKQIYDASANLYGDTNTEASKVTYTKYSVKGLLNEPNLMVLDAAGNSLSVTYNNEIKAFCTIQDLVHIIAPDNFKVSVNGIDITGQDKFVSEKIVEFKELSVAKKYMSKNINLVKYTVTGVDTNNVNIVSTNYEGLQTPVYYDTENGYYRVYNCMLEKADRDKLLSEYGLTEDRLTRYAKYYAEFVANDNDRWGTIMPYVMKDSAIYETFDSFWSVLADHNSFWYEDIKVKDISFYDKDTISCRVSFVYWIKGFAGKPDATESYPTDVTFYYVKKGDVWYITDWELHTEESK
ncbi:MAG: hypothetical protein E7384_00355 [Ruminococcaceae bacterium]|nr:hypothetical protein [Oscillospiraceae bacterium]